MVLFETLMQSDPKLVLTKIDAYVHNYVHSVCVHAFVWQNETKLESMCFHNEVPLSFAFHDSITNNFPIHPLIAKCNAQLNENLNDEVVLHIGNDDETSFQFI